MRTLLLHVERSAGWDPRNWVESRNGNLVLPRKYVVQMNNSWMSIEQSNDIIEDYDDAELKVVLKHISTPDVYLIEWRGEEVLKCFIEEFSEKNSAVMDNDQGVILPFSRVLELPLSAWLCKTGSGDRDG